MIGCCRDGEKELGFLALGEEEEEEEGAGEKKGRNLNEMSVGFCF